jgi:hypothetical protein
MPGADGFTGHGAEASSTSTLSLSPTVTSPALKSSQTSFFQMQPPTTGLFSRFSSRDLAKPPFALVSHCLCAGALPCPPYLVPFTAATWSTCNTGL